MNGSILVVDDDESMCQLVEEKLHRNAYRVQYSTSGEGAQDLLRERDFDLVLTDLNLGKLSGLGLCEWVAENRPDTPVIVITAFGSMDTAVGAIRAGAYDFITKPIDMELLSFAVQRGLRHRDLSREVVRLRRTATQPEALEGLVGESQAIRRVAELIARVSDSDATAVITGESGTGKEIVARALHANSRRRNGPFVPVNCAALPSNLLESELFGHVKGAFTDARTSRVGLLREANGGTLFLDEIAEMASDMQVKLLRALQERRVRPVGGSEEIPFDARIIAATNRDIETEVEEQRFREDLYYRINVVRLRVPPLRARGNDVLLLAQFFLKRICERSGAKQIESIAAPAARLLLGYDWPGNVRELENTMERAVALAQFNEVTVDDLPEKIQDFRSTKLTIASDNPDELLTLEELEKRYILRVLQTVQGNKTEAARVLGVDRRTLYRKLERFEKNGHDKAHECD